MRMLTFLFTASCLLFSCGWKKEKNESAVVEGDIISVDTVNGKSKISDTASVSISMVETQNFEVFTYENDSSLGGWGFDIYVDGRRYIHQPTVPVIAGTHGFETEEQSERAGSMMVMKLKEGRMPPSLDERDLELLGVK